MAFAAGGGMLGSKVLSGDAQFFANVARRVWAGGLLPFELQVASGFAYFDQTMGAGPETRSPR